MEKRQRSIKQWKERKLMNIFLGIRAIGVCEREWRQFACSSLVFSARDLDSAQGTDRALWSRSFLRSARVCYGGMSQVYFAEVLFKAQPDFTRSKSGFIHTTLTAKVLGASPWTTAPAPSVTPELHHSQPPLIPPLLFPARMEKK